MWTNVPLFPFLAAVRQSFDGSFRASIRRLTLAGGHLDGWARMPGLSESSLGSLIPFPFCDSEGDDGWSPNNIVASRTRYRSSREIDND
jgi:hypothetical protein